MSCIIMVLEKDKNKNPHLAMTQVQGKEVSITPIPRAAVGGVRSLVGVGQVLFLEA